MGSWFMSGQEHETCKRYKRSVGGVTGEGRNRIDVKSWWSGSYTEVHNIRFFWNHPVIIFINTWATWHMQLIMNFTLNEGLFIFSEHFAGYFPHCARLQKNGSYRTVKHPQTVHIHPSSGLAQVSSIHSRLPSTIFNTCVLLFVYNVIVYARTLL